MGKRLKQIKKQDLGEYGKKVIDSLINSKEQHGSEREESHESMRCKVEIFEGLQKKTLVDSFVVNTNSLRNTISGLVLKYGSSAQFNITNLYDEKVVVRRYIYIGGFDKEKDDREHFNKHMIIVGRIHALRDSGVTEDEACSKLGSIWAKSEIRRVYKINNEQAIQDAKDLYDNQNLGKYSAQDINSKDLNIKDDILDNNDLEGEEP